MSVEIDGVNNIIKADTISEVTSANGVTIDGLTIKDGNIIGDVALAGTTPSFTIGDGGAEDAKLLFDGNEQNFHIGLDDSTNKLTIGLGNNLGTYPGFTMDENTAVEFPDNTVTIISSGNHDMLTLKSTDADAGVGPVMAFVRDSASPANGDFLGALVFDADDSGGNTHQFVEINAVMQTATDGSEDGRLRISSAVGGTNRNRLDFLASETVFNEDSVDVDFRVESDGNANMLFVDGGDNVVRVGSSSHTNSLIANNHELVVGDESSGASGIAIVAPNNENSYVSFFDPDNSGSFRGSFNYNHSSDFLRTYVSGSERMRIASDGDVFIGTTSNYDGEILRVNKDGTNNIATFTSSNNGGAGQITITNSYSASSSTDETATIRFGLGNGGAAIQAYKASDTQTAVNRDVGLEFKVQDDNSEQVRFRIVNNGDLLASDTSIGSLSDVRLKKDIEDLNYSIDTFKALKPRTFNWKNPWLHAGETNRRGFVAQELKEVDPYWVSEQKAVKKSDDILDPATYYEEGDEIPEDKKIGDIKTEATYTYQYEKGDGSDYDLLNDGSELDNIEMIAKLGKKDAMYISVIQQLITRIETLEDA